MEKPREGEKKRYHRMKTTDIIIREAMRMRGAIVIERISGENIRI
jgi:hypothetical protein